LLFPRPSAIIIRICKLACRMSTIPPGRPSSLTIKNSYRINYFPSPYPYPIDHGQSSIVNHHSPLSPLWMRH
jgi:hypothetical protein